jgi:hypothetical protein
MLLAVFRSSLAGCVAVLALSGCSLGADEEPKSAHGAPKQVVASVERLERAVKRRHWRTICKVLFTPGARRRAGGADCPRRLRSDAQDLRRPRIKLVSIRVAGDRAQVRVRSRAAGQPPLSDVLELRRIGHRYRIEALAD